METNTVNPCRLRRSIQTKRMDRFVLRLLTKSIVLFLGACMLALLVGAA